MKETTTTAQTVCLKKDEKGYVHISVYSDGNLTPKYLTIRPEHVPAPTVTRTIVFLKEEALELLVKSKIITNVFKPADINTWCGFIDINIFFELENSESGIYSQVIRR